MPIFRLSPDLVFPPVHLAEEGLLAVGGDLSRERLLLAYRSGIFPWYSPGEPILWWSPDPRTVLLPGDLHVSRRLRRTLRQGVFQVTVDRCFSEVVQGCAETPRIHESGTWITGEMYAAYVALHHAGYAHSVEAWRDGELAGGFYGVALGACFFGESMFARVSDASKVAFAHFVRAFEEAGGVLIDCQISNPHLHRLGAREIPRGDFMDRLSWGLQRRLTRDLYGGDAALSGDVSGGSG